MNAIIMAAGTASRFVPLSEETPKGLLEVRGEILIERQIRQLKEAGIDDICIVLGYKAEMFRYLADKFDVRLVYNEDYSRYNNSSSVIRVIDRLHDTFICCSDHYYVRNVFMDRDVDSYYAAQYASGYTDEWCIVSDEKDFITDVKVGGEASWYMAGHVHFNPQFSAEFRGILQREYQREEVRNGYWEDVYIRHLNELPMKVRRYSNDDFMEFDSIDELRLFDRTYIENTRSGILKDICRHFSWCESELSCFKRIKHSGDFLMFSFERNREQFIYDGRTKSVGRR